MRPRCTRRLEIDAGHRVTRHESRCRNVHGHRYAFEITVEADDLDEAGRVVDFGVVKQLVGWWLDQNLDHGYIHHPLDHVGLYLVGQDCKTFEMPEDLGEPTAENLATLVAREAQVLLDALDRTEDVTHLRVVHVRCYETPNCWADWRAGE